MQSVESIKCQSNFNKVERLNIKYILKQLCGVAFDTGFYSTIRGKEPVRDINSVE